MTREFHGCEIDLLCRMNALAFSLMCQSRSSLKWARMSVQLDHGMEGEIVSSMDLFVE
jgi:hypothetical protein